VVAFVWTSGLFDLHQLASNQAVIALFIFLLFIVAIYRYPLALIFAGIEFFRSGHGDLGILIILFGIKEFFQIYGRVD
jgi:hypothetical protein